MLTGGRRHRRRGNTRHAPQRALGLEAEAWLKVKAVLLSSGCLWCDDGLWR